MKKILCALLILSFSFAVVGCKSEETNIPTNLPPGYSLEDYFSQTNDCVKAIYKTTTVYPARGEYVHEFEVTESFRGLIPKQTILVKETMQTSLDEYFGDTSNGDIAISEDPYDPTYSQWISYLKSFRSNESYLLLLRIHSDVYTTTDQYSMVWNNLRLSLNSSGAVDLERSTCMGGSLKEHLSLKETQQSFENGTFETYLLEKIQGNPLGDHKEYLKSEDKEVILPDSEYVLEVTLESSSEDFFSGNWIRYLCRVNAVYKGSLETQEIWIDFIPGTVTLNQSYIVAVNLRGSSYFEMSSRNSVFDCAERETVQKILQEILGN